MTAGPLSATLVRRAPARPQTRETLLLARAQRGDVAAFEELAGERVDRLFALALRLVGDRADAEDLVQETLLRAWRGIRSFRGGSTFFTWLYRIAVNEANRSRQKGARRPQTIELSNDQVQAKPSLDDQPGRRAENEELRAALKGALLSLPHGGRPARHRRSVHPRGGTRRRRWRGRV